MAGHRPFARLSHDLAAAGYAVLRWDDRSVGGSEGDYLAASAETLVEDGANAMSLMRAETGDARHILIGHSQGTLIAARTAAAHSDQTAALILLAGMGAPGREALLDQHCAICRAEGWEEHEIAASRDAKAEIFAALAAAQGRLESGESAILVLKDLEQKLYQRLLGGVPVDSLSESEKADIGAAVDDLLEWEWRYLVTVDPADDLEKVECPVFAMTGDKDTQVDAGKNLEAIRTACSNGRAPRVDVKTLENHNHLFQETASGALSAYETAGPPFSDTALAAIRRWLAAINA
jgi:hypothetical protein